MSKETPSIRFKGFETPWSISCLGDALACDLKYGLNAPAVAYDGKHKYLRITDIDEATRLFSQDNVTSPGVSAFEEEYKLQPNDIVFARTGASVGKSYLFKEEDGDVYFAGFLIRGKINEKFNPAFIFQTTLSKEYSRFVKLNSQRSGQPGLNAEQYFSFCFHHPQDDAEQNSIADFLSDIDRIIFSLTKEISKLGNLKSAMLQKMFPRNGKLVPEVRFKGFEGNWVTKSLGECFEEGNARGCDEGTLLSVSMSEGVNETSDFIKTRTVSDFSNYKKVQPDDIVYNSMRMWQGASGCSRHCGFVSPAYTVARPLEGIWAPFFAYLFKRQPMLKIFESRSQGLTSDTWNLKFPAFSQIEVTVPADEKEQIYIASFFQRLDSLIAAKKAKLTKLQNLKASCLSKMFVNISD